MARQYVCENCGATYDCMLIDWPDCCSMECARIWHAQEILTAAACSVAEARPTPTSTKANGRAQ